MCLLLCYCYSFQIAVVLTVFLPPEIGSFPSYDTPRLLWAMRLSKVGMSCYQDLLLKHSNRPLPAIESMKSDYYIPWGYRIDPLL